MRLGIIAGNRRLPLILAKNLKQNNKNAELIAICFKGETSRHIEKYVDKTYWIKVGSLRQIKEIMQKEALKEWVMAGQINPLAIFKRKCWDEDLTKLMEEIKDIRPHTVFSQIIGYLEKEGAVFLDSTSYLKNSLADEGIMNNLSLNENTKKDIDFGVDIISRFVELDVGQTIVVKAKSVLALESLEGTDRTISRGYTIGKKGCTVLKFSKSNQDLRFDVPVVGISTLRLLKRINAASLVLEKDKVLILEKDRFLSLANKWNIPVVGCQKY